MTFSPQLRPVLDDVLGPSFGVRYDPDRLWQKARSLDWHVIGVPEAAGGAGGDLADLIELAAAVGRHAVALPVVETALACWALAGSGRPTGPAQPGAALALVRAGDTHAVARHLPRAHTFVVLHAGELHMAMSVIPVDGLSFDSGTDLADEPVGRLATASLPAAGQVRLDADLAEGLLQRLALTRAAAIHGAAERAVDLVVEHIRNREQFGRPLAAHQAVAQLAAGLACERDLLAASITAALDSPHLAVAARTLAARSAGAIAAWSHQLMGAMGITREHPLQLVTRRLWAWRDAEGSQWRWEEQLGGAVIDGVGDDALWSLAPAGAQAVSG